MVAAAGRKLAIPGNMPLGEYRPAGPRIMLRHGPASIAGYRRPAALGFLCRKAE